MKRKRTSIHSPTGGGHASTKLASDRTVQITPDEAQSTASALDSDPVRTSVQAHPTLDLHFGNAADDAVDEEASLHQSTTSQRVRVALDEKSAADQAGPSNEPTGVLNSPSPSKPTSKKPIQLSDRPARRLSNSTPDRGCISIATNNEEPQQPSVKLPAPTEAAIREYLLRDPDLMPNTTQSSRSVPASQVDPIDTFSSPPRTPTAALPSANEGPGAVAEGLAAGVAQQDNELVSEASVDVDTDIPRPADEIKNETAAEAVEEDQPADPDAQHVSLVLEKGAVVAAEVTQLMEEVTAVTVDPAPEPNLVDAEPEKRSPVSDKHTRVHVRQI
jgi:hypothetical protein